MPFLILASTPGGLPTYTALEDVSLNVSASHQALIDILMSLDATDGSFMTDVRTLLQLWAEYQGDIPTGLSAYFQGVDDVKIAAVTLAQWLRDAKTSLEAMGQGISDIHISAYLGKQFSRDLGISLRAVAPIIFRNLYLHLNVTDGSSLNDVTLMLMAVPLSRPKRKDIYHRISSVITRVT